jgi:hypothetical protein
MCIQQVNGRSIDRKAAQRCMLSHRIYAADTFGFTSSHTKPSATLGRGWVFGRVATPWPKGDDHALVSTDATQARLWPRGRGPVKIVAAIWH